MNRFHFEIVGFDLDGTLVDTHQDLAAALNHALGLANRPALPLATTRTLIGGGTAKMLERGLLETGGMISDETRFAELRDALIAYYEAHIAVHSRLFPGGEAMLDTLRERGVKLAVVTNKLEHLAVRLIGALGLSSRFYTIIGGDTLGPGCAKPAPDLLLEMVARGGGGPAAYVGDTTFDTRAAAAAAIPCIAVSFGYNDVPAGQLGAASVVHHFDALPAALERLGG
jgi:phosphoglycolate phosphatase